MSVPDEDLSKFVGVARIELYLVMKWFWPIVFLYSMTNPSHIWRFRGTETFKAQYINLAVPEFLKIVVRNI